MFVYEEIVLMKKIADYFRETKKFSIAKIIIEEFDKEVANFPNFHEPEYIKEDLKTIFNRHLKTKKRQSEVRLEKTLHKTAQNNENNSTKKYDRSAVKKKSIAILNDNNTNNNNNNQETVEVAQNVIVNNDVTLSSIFQETDMNNETNNHINHNIVNPVTSTPLQNTNNNNENRNPFLTMPDQSSIKVENNVAETDFEDDEMQFSTGDDDVIIIDHNNNFCQTLYNSNTLLDDDASVFITSMENYNASRKTLSQSLEIDALIKTEPCLINTETNLMEPQSEIHAIDKVILEKPIENIEITDHMEPQSEIHAIDKVILEKPIENIEITDHIEHISINNSLQNLDNEKNNVGDEIMIVEEQIHQTPVEPIITVTVPEIPKKQGCEIATQCDQNDILQQTNPTQYVQNNILQQTTPIQNVGNNILEQTNPIQYVQNDILRQTTPTQSVQNNILEQTNPIVKNLKRFHEDADQLIAKKARLECLDTVDLDDEDLFPTQEIVPTQDSKQNVEVKHRSRNSSLSSIETLPDEITVPSTTNSKQEKKTKISFKILVPFKDNKQLDMEKRILLSDGWLLWPRALLSSCLKLYSITDFQSVLMQYGVVEHESLESRLELLDLCLLHMSQQNLIVRGYHSDKKVHFYMKLASLSEIDLKNYDIELKEYENCFWNKSFGPKTGRKLCAESAPENVKRLLGVEMLYVESIIAVNGYSQAENIEDIMNKTCTALEE